MGITLEGGMTAVPLQFFAHYPLTRGTRTYTQGRTLSPSGLSDRTSLDRSAPFHRPDAL